MENLTKENFFNEMMTQHPEGMKVFCAWVDEYKKRVNWNDLFNSSSNWQDANGKNATAPKFHDLPIAFQWGIYLQFLSDNGFEYQDSIWLNNLAGELGTAFIYAMEKIESR